MFELNEDYGLGAWYLKAATAASVSARKHIVDSNEVIARLLKSSLVLFVCSTRQLRFSRSLQPPDVVFGAFAAVRATVRRLFNFFLFVKEIALVHN